MRQINKREQFSRFHLASIADSVASINAELYKVWQEIKCVMYDLPRTELNQRKFGLLQTLKKDKITRNIFFIRNIRCNLSLSTTTHSCTGNMNLV